MMADFYTLRREKVVILWETFFPFEPIHYYLAIDIWSYNRFIMRLEIAISPWKSYKLVFELFPQASNSFSLQIFLYQMAWNFLNQNCSTTGFKTMSIFWSHKKIMDYHFQTTALSFLKTLRQQGLWLSLQLLLYKDSTTKWEHYAPETFKMWSWGMTLLKFDNLTVTPVLGEIKF